MRKVDTNQSKAPLHHRTPLHIAASEGATEVAQLLLSAGASPRARASQVISLT